MSWSNPITAQHTITARFGETGPQWSSGSHTGLDFSAPTGTHARAVDDGTVIFVGYSGRYGNLVKIRHSGVDSWYAHLSAFNVRLLQKVTRGQIIGAVGSTGNATGPHLHLEARVAGNPVDPARYLSGEGTSAGGVLGAGIGAGVAGGLGLDVGIFDAFSRLTDVVGFVTDPKNWYRIALIVGGGVMLVLALLVARKGSVI
jgi:hypothetical protein